MGKEDREKAGERASTKQNTVSEHTVQRKRISESTTRGGEEVTKARRDLSAVP